MISRSKLSSTVAALLLLAAAPDIGMAQAAARATPAGKAVVLFDGKSLTGWKPIETPQMALLPDGSVANQRGKGLLLYTERQFKDFTLELDYLPEAGSAAAGVFLRLPQEPATLDAAERSAYEVKLGEDKPPAFREPVHYTRSMFLSGAINLVGADSMHHRDQMSPRRFVSRAPGTWNTLRVDAVGQRYTVYVNGEKVNDFFGRKATEGYIGLVNRTPDFSVRFRNVRVTPRTATNAPSGVGELVATRDQRPPIKVLMVTATHGFRHTYGIEGAVELMRELEKTTELRVDTTENLANLNSANLAKYDLLFFANTTLRINPKDTTQAALRAVRLRAPIPNAVTPEQQRALLDFVRGGKGIVLAHAALDANYGWDDYREMVGGGLFESHPWTTHLRVTQRSEDQPRDAPHGRQVLDPRGVLHPRQEPARDEPRAALARQRVVRLAQHGPAARTGEQRPSGVVDADVRAGPGVRDDPRPLPRYLAAAGVRAASADGDADGGGAADRRRAPSALRP